MKTAHRLWLECVDLPPDVLSEELSEGRLRARPRRAGRPSDREGPRPAGLGAAAGSGRLPGRGQLLRDVLPHRWPEIPARRRAGAAGRLPGQSRAQAARERSRCSDGDREPTLRRPDPEPSALPDKAEPGEAFQALQEAFQAMVTIRLARAGAKRRPFYHVVVADSRSPRGGRFIERIGFYNPIASGKEERLRIDTARVEYWKSHGAQPSDTVARLLRSM